ncbi:hypothetical protein ATHL_02863 [Anaerolinea thermolimosa]|nr:hypothetical protein ATHL_02863 [Anaerolinea thermolimosa]
MKCNTEAGIVFDVGSLYAHFQGLQDIRKSIRVRYLILLGLLLIVLAKMRGEGRPRGIAEWAKPHGNAVGMAEVEELEHIQLMGKSGHRRCLAHPKGAFQTDCGSGERLSLVCERRSDTGGGSRPFVVRIRRATASWNELPVQRF